MLQTALRKREHARAGRQTRRGSERNENKRRRHVAKATRRSLAKAVQIQLMLALPLSAAGLSRLVSLRLHKLLLLEGCCRRARERPVRKWCTDSIVDNTQTSATLAIGIRN
jgi:hypothetical protein